MRRAGKLLRYSRMVLRVKEQDGNFRRRDQEPVGDLV